MTSNVSIEGKDEDMSLILWPAVITLAITLLRLFGELSGWSKALVNPAAGGAGALIGISWLPIVLGPYFAWKLAQQGKGPANAWKTAGLALAAIAIAIGMFVGAQKLGPMAFVGAFFVSLALAFIPWKSWPELARTLFAYALAARVPVVIVMLIAILGNWGTHYDVLPPDPPPMLLSAGPLARWFWIGLLPQMTIWIANTVLVGTLLGAALVALAKPKPAA
jgi:hypothetical protein